MAIDLLRKLDATLPPATRDALQRAVAVARERGLGLSLVGGAVRDLLLDAGQIDLDIVVSEAGPKADLAAAIDLAGAVAEAVGGRAVAHRRFGTATVRLAAGHLDLTRARSERYRQPGALPEVAPGSLVDDLARRDLTINAMALRLDGGDAGSLVDPHGGRADLDRKLIRTLHESSFRDDATRILRALRYAGRLGFELEPATREALRRDRGCLDTISGARLRRELERVAIEDRVADIVRATADHGALAAIDPALRTGDRELRAIEGITSLPVSHRDVALLSALLWRASTPELEHAIVRLALTGRQATASRDVAALRGEALAISEPSLRPSDVVRLLDARVPAAIESFALLTDNAAAADRAREYLTTWRHVRPRLSGRDVEALGVAHGPAVGEALARLRAARLDGETASRDDEVALVSELRPKALAGASRG